LTNSSSYREVLALTATNTTLAGGAAGITALLVNFWYLERYTGEPIFELKKAMNGALGGLVSVAASCGIIEPWAAVVTGSIAGVFYLLASRLLIRIRIDDACDAIPVHGFCGLWGLIASGLFASPMRLTEYYGRGEHPGLLYSWRNGKSDFRLLGAQIVGALFIVGWVVLFMLPFFVWLDWKGWLRSDPLEELVGLDTSYHGGLALHTNDSDVKPEYITAYKERQIELNKLKRRSPRTHQFEQRIAQSMDKIEEDEEELEADDGFDPKISL
jgi:ammonium transporter, Amt family